MKHTTKLLVIGASVVSTAAFATAGWTYWSTTGSGSGTAAVGTWSSDTTAPALTALEMFDTNENGKVDEVRATFSETLAPYTAGSTPWTLANAPSAGSLGAVSIQGAAAILSINEGTSAADTAVGTFTVALTASSTGIRDVDGNQSSFPATAPTDRARPTLVSATSGGGTLGLMQSADFLNLNFSEPIAPAPVPTSATVTESRSNSTASLTIPGLIQTTSIDTSYIQTGTGSATSTGTVTLMNSNRTIRIVLGTVTGNPKAGNGSVILAPDAAITDPAGNQATASASVTQLF